MGERIEKHITITSDDIQAIDVLADNTALSRQQLKTAMSNGAVWLETQRGTQRIRRAKKTLRPGNILHLYYDSRIQSHTTAAALLVADKTEYSIWNKPCGMFSQGSKWGDHNTLYRWAETHLQPARPAYPVHRLDRAASGLMILAHNRKTAAAFADMFRSAEITKHYRATVEGRVTDDDLPRVLDEALDDKPASTQILQACYDAATDTTTLEINLVTGRKHQIRRHLSRSGHPIVGDRLYGANNTHIDLQLTSVYLAFKSPISGKPEQFSID